MNKNKKFIQLIERIVERKLNEQGNPFWRLPKKVVRNEVYSFKQEVNTATDKLLNGQDFDAVKWGALKSLLNHIIDSAEQFNSEEEVPEEYRH